MKHRSWIVLCCLSMLFVLGCFDEEGSEDSVYLGDPSQSECKNQDDNLVLKALSDDADLDDAGNSDFYIGALDYRTEGTDVTVYHFDSLQNCSAEMAFNMELRGNEITLTEVNTSEELSRCTCRMDLEVTIHNLVDGETYYIEVYNEDHSTFYGRLTVEVGEPCDLECVEPEDCWGLDIAIPDCVGDWACIENTCQWHCGMDWECASDSDCPEGMICEYVYPTDPDYYCDEDGECWDNTTGTPNPGVGYCVSGGDECRTDYDCYTNPNVPQPDCEGYFTCDMGYCNFHSEPWYECIDDADCPEGYFCAVYPMVDGLEEGELDENGEPMPTPYPMGGECIPYSQECTSDADCWEVFETGAMPIDDCEGDFSCINGMCVWDCTEPEECRDDADCWELFETGQIGIPDCEGNFVCLENQCQWECFGGEECRSDYDCPADMVCEFGPEGFGQCVPGGEPLSCYDDMDCPTGYFCEINWDDAGYWNELDAEGSSHCGGAERCIPEGVCKPIEQPEECYSDADCPDGMVCELAVYEGEETCIENPDGTVDCYGSGTSDGCWIDENGEIFCVEPPYPGVCVEATNPEPECYVDSDCPEGMICEFPVFLPQEGDCIRLDDGTVECYEEPVPYSGGICVPSPNPECSEDADCPEGMVCYLVRTPADPNYPCNEDDPALCETFVTGICEYPLPSSDFCTSNADCDEGFICEFQDVTEECIEYDDGSVECWSTTTDPATGSCWTDEAGEVVCDFYGVCVPDEPNPILPCETDDDCPTGSFCAAVDCASDPDTDCYGSNICLPFD